MNETEIERMVVRLTGDGSGLQRMYQQAQTSTAVTAAQIQTAGTKIENIAKSVKTFAMSAVAAMVAFGATAWLQQGLHNYAEAETVGIRLTATLEANERQVDSTREAYEEFAASMEKLSTYEDDQILKMLTVAESFKLTGEAAQDAVRNAIGLASITGGSAEGLIRLTAALAEGDIERAMHMARMVPQLRGIKEQSEFVARAQQLINAGMKSAQAEMQSYSGMMKMLHRDYGNMIEDFGKVVADGIKPFIDGARQLIAMLREMSPQAKTTVVVIAALVAGLAAMPAVALAAGFALSILFGPVGVALAAVIGIGALIAYWIEQLGGVAKAWDHVKDTAYRLWLWMKPTVMEAKAWFVSLWESVKAGAGIAWDWVKQKTADIWAWMRPIIAASIGFIVAHWRLVAAIAQSAWDVVKTATTAVVGWIMEAWDYLFDGTAVDWQGIQDVILFALISIEYGLGNLDRIAEVVWAGMKLYAVVAWDYMVDAAKIGVSVMTGVLVGLIRGFDAHWNNIKVTAQMGWNFLQAGWTALGQQIRAALNPMQSGNTTFRATFDAELERLNSSVASFQDEGAAAAQGYTNGFNASMNALGGVGASALQRRLRAEFDAAYESLDEDFMQFYARRLREVNAFEFSLPRGTLEAAQQAGEQVGAGFATAAKKETEKFDAALAHSAEAMSRIAAFRDRMERKPTGGTQARASDNINFRPNVSVSNTVQPATNPAPDVLGTTIAAMPRLLEVANRLLERIANQPPMEVEEVDL